MPLAATSTRRKQAKQSFQNAAECIGPVEAGMSLFAITRGQFSMIDAVLHCLDCVGPASLSLWTWTVAEYEVQCADHDFAIYADSFLSYLAAAENVAKNGDIVLHPRTGAPIDNPYSAVRERAAAQLRKIQIQTGILWDSPTRWLTVLTDPEDPEPPLDEFAPLLARDEEEAVRLTGSDFEPPYVIWVKSDADAPTKRVPINA